MKDNTDYRKTSPGLHLLYTKWAVTHLKAIDECIEELGKFSNINLLDIITAMQEEREKLVQTNKAYTDAQEILTSISS